MAKHTGLMTIGQVAQQVEVASSTLRFYEREGLIRPTKRSKAGYRLFDREALEQLRFIRAGQAIGFALNDIKALLLLDEETSCKRVQRLIEQRLVEIDAKLVNLKRLRSTLNDALGRCRKSKRGCAVVADLKGMSKKRKTLYS
ncbi:MAG: MerR family transcriptional regulator [Planctomycetes bacterium]|nr:MerR family transcriptional regulator [Planctomycetota bacterium]